MKITIGASFGGKIPTGSYQNMSPNFHVSEEREIDDTLQDINSYIKTRQQVLQGICYTNFEAEALKAKILKIQSDRKDFHWYKLPDGSEAPSVTSILGYDTEYFVDDDELKQYAAQGTIIHAQVENYIKTGKWSDPRDIPGIGAELFIIKSGKLSLPLSGWDFPGFLKKYPIKITLSEVTVVNPKDKYGGRFDFEGRYQDEGQEELATLCDVKRTPDKVKNFMQLAAYAKCSGMEHIKQLMVVPLNDKNKCGYEKPLITREVDRYFELFMYKRVEFKKVYGI